MEDNQLMLSIIIPLYNSSETVSRLAQQFSSPEVNEEIILVNDGSSDNTAELCRKLEKEHSEVRFIDKPHSGVSDTRNAGIREAKGKYILFLDADDKLSEGSIPELVRFAEKCGDEVDLITYPIITYYRGQLAPPHFRYETMRESGIYDLNIYPYIGQTTMNIMVRNMFEDNVLFDTSMNFSEDQNYCCDVLKKKLKIGFCNEATYIYYRSESSSSGKLNGACYIFEQSMRMFEKMFSGYKAVPAAFQGLYINDLAWKLRSNILYPYNYDPDSFDFAMQRIRSLLSKVDVDVITEHPAINFFHKFYWLSLKPDIEVKPFFLPGSFGLDIGGNEIYRNSKFEIVVVRIRIDNGTFIFRGFIKSPIFLFSKKPVLHTVINGKRREQKLFLSAHGYYMCRTRTNIFYGFCFEHPLDKLENLEFKVNIGGYSYNCTFLFMPKSPFSHLLKRYDSVIGNTHIHYNTDSGEFSIGEKDISQVLLDNTSGLPSTVRKIRRRAVKLRKDRIHLYCDCRGVERDNGLYKFLKDHERKDGIIRKYICDPENKNIKNIFTADQMKDVVNFGSREHKELFLACEKIFTAYIEDINLFPFESCDYDMYSDFFGFEVVYLQHGVLHGSLPWKYTPEVITADKICVSTTYEERLFHEKYHFRKEDIIPEVMPRLKTIDRTKKPEKKILYAPSWRQYLIGPDIDGKWQPEPGVFLNSDYYKKINGLLCSEELDKLLKEHGYTLEFKLHPIFSVYTGLFKINSDRVRVVDKADSTENYEIFITDFSSFAYDFLYAGRKVFSFIPDREQFDCGMNSYREIEPESLELFETLNGPEDLHKLFESDSEIKRPVFFDN